MIRNGLIYMGIVLFTIQSLMAQWDFSGELNAVGRYPIGKNQRFDRAPEDKRMPFWFVNNQRGRFADDTKFGAWVNAQLVYTFNRETELEFGGGVLARDGGEENLFVDEAYAKLKFHWLDVVLGLKQEDEKLRGLSATNDNMIWSLNARPMPGIQLKTNRPVMIFPYNGIAIEASWNEYLMGNDRFVEDTRLHYKYLKLIYTSPREDIALKFGLHHAAQWAGNSPTNGSRPKDFKNYIKMFFGSSVANQLGMYEFSFRKRLNKDWNLNLTYNYMFESLQGAKLSNIPDGRYSVFLDSEEDRRLVNGILYEFYYTRNQNILANSNFQNEDYFNHSIYQSGWTNQRRIIGLPFFDYDEEQDAVIGNKFVAHHIGLSGEFFNYFETYPYQLLLSYIYKDGRHGKYYTPAREVFAGMFSLGVWRGFIDVDAQVGIEVSNVANPIYGIGLQLRKQF